MVDWLYEGRLAVYVVLAAAAGFLLLRWWQTRRRPWLVAGGVALALLGLYFALDRLVESDREQVRRKVEEMAAAVKARNAPAICAHVSDQFRLDGVDKRTFCELADRMMRSGQVTEITVWDFRFPPDFRSPHHARGDTRPTQQAVVQFMAKPKGAAVPESAFFSCSATFIRDPDGQWRLRTFQVFNPGSTEPLQIPQLTR